MAEGLPQGYGERWDLLSTLIEGVLVEQHASTPEEFKELVRYGRMMAADTLTEGIVLYANEGYLAEICSLFERAREELGLVRVGNAWVRRRLLAGRGQP